MLKKENRGGKREGAGRPKAVPSQFSDQFKKNVMAALKRKAGEFGFSNPLDALATLALDPGVQDAVRLGCWKIIADMNTVKHTKQTVDINRYDMPQVYLPEPLPKPPEAIEKERAALSGLH